MASHVGQRSAAAVGHLLVFGAARGIDLRGDVRRLAAVADHAKVTVRLLADQALGLGAARADMAWPRSIAMAERLMPRASRAIPSLLRVVMDPLL